MKLPLALALSTSILAVACGGSPPSEFSDDAGGGNGNGNGQGGGFDAGSFPSDGGGTPIFTGGGGEDAAATNGCSAASQLVYVLSTSNDIYSFDPPSKTFTKLLTLSCAANGMTPNSMAVDREGNAWVNYVAEDALTGEVTGGSVFKVNLSSGACTASTIQLTTGWYQLGMGYSTASATDTTDTLYVANTNNAGAACGGFGGGGGGGGGNTSNAGLAMIDTDAGTLTTIGPFSGSLAGQSAELTGTGDGRLFGFFVLSPIQVAQIAKTSGATSNAVTMNGVACPQAWAFSFWGGDFYLYTATSDLLTGSFGNSTVTHYTSADGGIDTSYVADAGFTIVGAGVSTCAPTTPPTPK